MSEETLRILYQRTSVRIFTGEAVGQETLTELVKAGMAAPTAVNSQPWEFVLVTQRQKLDALCAGLPYAKMLQTAGAAIVVCAMPEQSHRQSPEMAVIDCSAATENILLAAEALGLGAVWTAVYPYDDRMDTVRQILAIPATAIPLNVIPVGHPAGAEKPKDKFKPEKIHWEKW